MTNSDHSIHRPDGAKNDSVKVPRKNFMNNSLSITAEKYSAVKKLIQHKFSIHIAIKYASLEIEQKLREKIISIKRVKKAYGSNANSFFVKTTSVDGTQKTYFLKFGRNKNIDDELKGDSYIQGTLRTPKIVLSSKSKFFGHEWILYEHVHGRLMNEVLLDIRDDKALNGFFDLERQKEASLSSLYYRSVSFIDYKGYIESMANRLFYKRLVGNFYKEFYERGSDNISSLFDRVMIVNNKRLPLTINQIIDNIKRKYHDAEYSSNKIRSIVGHGDAHHGNIIVEGDIWFIDNEYADITTPFMELAKPYYNDFLGDLFFHQHELLNEYFKIISYKDTGKEIHIEIVIRLILMLLCLGCIIRLFPSIQKPFHNPDTESN